MENKTVLISGASVAGPALAYWLRRYGFLPTVVERAPELRGGGQAVDLRGAAREAVDRMGLLPAVREAHTGVRGMAYVDGRGNRVAAMAAGDLGDSGGVIADLEILRSDLARILYEATVGDVEYVFDDSITELTETPDGVDVRFERSAPRTFDLVVGADGLHSNVRRLAFGPEERYVTDGGYYQAIFGMRTDVEMDGWQQMYAMPGRLASLYPLDGGQARAMFFFRSPPLRYDRRDVAGQKRIVADAFAGGEWEVPPMLESLRDAGDLYFDRVSKVSVDRWSSGRAVLLGDSAFGGSVGMGTSMAMVGAYVLAGELAAAGGDHATAFPRYENALRDYVTENQKPMPGGLRGFLPPTRFEIWLRNKVMNVMLRMPFKDKVTGGLQETANAVVLRDYAVSDHSMTASASPGTTPRRA